MVEAWMRIALLAKDKRLAFQPANFFLTLSNSLRYPFLILNSYVQLFMLALDFMKEVFYGII